MTSGSVYKTYGEAVDYIVKDDSKVVKYALERWDGAYAHHMDRAEKKRTRVVNSKTELYQLTSLYILFQGVVLGVVSRATGHKWYHAIVPALFSALVSSVAILTVRDRLSYYYEAREALSSEVADARMTKRKISYVLSRGANFKFEDMDRLFPPQHSAGVTADAEAEATADAEAEAEGSRLLCQSKKSQGTSDEYTCHVTRFLVIFAVLVVTSCFVI